MYTLVRSVYLYVLDTAPCITEPQVVVSITGKKSWLNLCLCVCIARTKNALFASQREKTSLHDVNLLIKSQYFQNMKIMIVDNVNMCNIAFS